MSPSGLYYTTPTVSLWPHKYAIRKQENKLSINLLSVPVHVHGLKVIVFLVIVCFNTGTWNFKCGKWLVNIIYLKIKELFTKKLNIIINISSNIQQYTCIYAWTVCNLYYTCYTNQLIYWIINWLYFNHLN